MAMNWTKEQKQVIESRNRNLLVSAAAGSGKTAVLVERIIQMISDKRQPVDIDRLLVMTFTKAAAAEMRERIQSAIEKKLQEEPENVHLQQQAVTVQYAQITTIDSFCLHILKEHFDRLTIDPAFHVADEGELLMIKSDVMEKLLEDYYENGGETFERFVDTYAIGKTDGGIADYIEQVYTFAQSNPWPAEWISACKAELSQGTFFQIDETPWMRFLLRDVRIQAEEWERQLEAAIALCREEDGPEPYLPMICEDLDGVRGLKTVETYEGLSLFAGRIVFSKLAAVRGKNSPVNPDKKEIVAACRKRVKAAVEKLKEQYLYDSPENILLDMCHGGASVNMLLELTEEYMERMRQKKREKNVVDFNDLEHFALEILLEETDGKTRRTGMVADEISRQYDEILVDEYQDSNLVQETLIKSISRERFGTPNVFMVGDVKQSIYKFRLAKPELFLEKYHTYSAEEGCYQKIELHQNFRSRAEVLESVNLVFERIMTEKLGGITYTEETALHPGALFEERGELSELKTELLLLDTSGSALEALDEETSDYTTRELEAAAIAGKIREMTDSETGITVWDKEKNSYRRVDFKDIVILLRSVSGWAESFTEILSHQGIPAFAESRTGYFDTLEVNTILNFLAVLDNPIQDIPLAAVLRAPFFGVTENELAHLTAVYKRKATKSRDRGLYGAVADFMDKPEDGQNERDVEESFLLKKLEKAFSLLEELRKEAVYLPLHQLLYRIFDRTGYYHYVSAMPAGEVRQANLNMLVEKAAAYEKTSYRGVFHFIRYIEKLRKYNTDFGEASTVTEQGNTVRIMSIHKSKGLEFPIVILAGMGKLFNKQDVRGKILIDPDFGIGTDYLDSDRHLKGPTLKKNAMKRRMELDALGEELRVLYVAMTRAKEKLILTASDKNMETKRDKWEQLLVTGDVLPFTVLTLASSYLDWILMSLKENPLIQTRQVEVGALLGREIEEQFFRKTSKQELLSFDTGCVYDLDYRERLRRSFEYAYPHCADVLLNTKMSVSELKKQSHDEGDNEEESGVLPELIPTLPAFMEQENKEKKGGVTRGTAYHRVMELLPFDKIGSEADLRDCINRFVENGKMTEAAAELVFIPDIWRFMESDLGKRVAKASKNGRLFREKQFVMGVPAREMGDWDSDELVLIQGIIDSYFEEENGLVLIDYKTDYVDSAGELVTRYKNQLDYYERALSQVLKKPVKEKIIYSYRLGSVIV